MKNILILLLIFSIGFSGAWYLRRFDITAQVHNEQIAEWKGQWCSESCGTPVMNLSEVCDNYLGELKEKEIIKAQREANIWFDGVKEGHRRR